MAKKKRESEDAEAPEPQPETAPSPKDELLAVLDSAPIVPLLNDPKIDPQHLMATTFTPAYRQFLQQLRDAVECRL